VAPQLLHVPLFSVDASPAPDEAGVPDVFCVCVVPDEEVPEAFSCSFETPSFSSKLMRTLY
jgi:hypothetical protein